MANNYYSIHPPEVVQMMNNLAPPSPLSSTPNTPTHDSRNTKNAFSDSENDSDVLIKKPPKVSRQLLPPSSRNSSYFKLPSHLTSPKPMMVTPIQEESTRKKKKVFMKKSNSPYDEASTRVPRVDYSSTERTLRILKGETYSPPSVSSLEIPDDEFSIGKTKHMSSKKSPKSLRHISRAAYLETDAPDDEIMMTSAKRNILAEMDEFEDALVQARSSDSDLEKKVSNYPRKSPKDEDSSKTKSGLSTVIEHRESFERESTRDENVLTIEVADGNIEMESICLPSLRQDMEEGASKNVLRESLLKNSETNADSIVGPHGLPSTGTKNKLGANIGKLQEVVSRDLEFSEKVQENVSISEVLRDAAFFSKIAANSLAAASIASVEAAGAAVEKMLMGKSKDKIDENKVTSTAEVSQPHDPEEITILHQDTGVSQALDSVEIAIRHQDTEVSNEGDKFSTKMDTDSHDNTSESPNCPETTTQLASVPLLITPIKLKVEKDLARKEREAKVKAITKTHLESIKSEADSKLSPNNVSSLEATPRKLNYCVNRIVPVHIPFVTKKQSAKSSNDKSFIRNGDEDLPDDEKKVTTKESEDQSMLERGSEKERSSKEASIPNESALEDIVTLTEIQNTNFVSVEKDAILISKKEEDSSNENLIDDVSIMKKDPASHSAITHMDESTEEKERDVDKPHSVAKIADKPMVQGYSTKSVGDGLMDSKSSESMSATGVVHSQRESENPITAEVIKSLAVHDEGTDSSAIDIGGKLLEESCNTEVKLTMEMASSLTNNGSSVQKGESIGIDTGSEEPSVLNPGSIGSKLDSISPSIIQSQIPGRSLLNDTVSQIKPSDVNVKETLPVDLKSDKFLESDDMCGSNSTSTPNDKGNQENSVKEDKALPDAIEDFNGGSQPDASPLSSEAKTTNVRGSSPLNIEDTNNQIQTLLSSEGPLNVISKRNISLSDASGREGMSDMFSIASLGTEIQSNKAPILVDSLDNENGICKGDVLISLLLGEDSDTSILHGCNQVANAVWRNRIMRRNFSLHTSTEVSMGISGNPPRRRNVLPVDVDNMHVIGALDQIKALEYDAIDHLRHDEFEDALELYDDILYAYREAFKSRLWNENGIDRKVEYRMQTYIGNVMHNIGLIHLLKKDFNKALSSFEKAAESRKSSDGILNSEALETKIKIGICLFALGHRTMARNALEVCLDLSKQLNKDTADLMRTAEILNNLGCINYIAGEPEVALEFFNQSLSVQQSVLSLSLYGRSPCESHAANLNISIINSNLAQLKVYAKDYGGAVTLLESILSTQQMLLQDTHESVRSTMENLASSNQILGNNDKGLRMYQRLLASLIQVFGADHSECKAIESRIEAFQMSNPDSKEKTRKSNSVTEEKVRTQPRLLKFFSPTLRKAKRQISKEVTP